MKNTILHLALAAAMAVTVSCSSDRSGRLSGPDPLVSHIDESVRPGDDFFHYANGKWFKENPIPPSEPSNGLWQLIQDTINAQIRNICGTSAALTKVKKGSDRQKIGDFFFSGMDSVSLNQKGLSDLKPELEMIDSVRDAQSLLRAASRVHAVSSSPLFSFFVAQDDKISDKYAVFITQGGLSLPERSFYFDTDANAVSVRSRFRKHAGGMFRILGCGDTEAGQAAANFIRLETALAKASRKREDTRDPIKNYNKMSLKQLCETTPGIDWSLFMESAGLRGVDTVVVGQPEFLAALDSCFRAFPVSTWRHYLKYHLVRGLAPYLNDKTYLESFRFYSGVLRGVQEPKPRWKRTVEQTDRKLGELVGRVYAEEYLPEGTKKKLLEIGEAVKTAYAGRIRKLDWMGDATKTRALKKLGTVIMKVGYPDRWKNMDDLQIDRSSYVRNAMKANQWAFKDNISRFGRPVDRTEWDMHPQTYNAYYNPSNNELCVPGCNIMVPGYERVMADDALLYAMIGGSTFGHEIIHGFDDQGCKYDERGNLSNWWTREDSLKFVAKTGLIVAQYNGYVAVENLHINGEMTQGENIADLAGLTLGYEAFKKTGQFRNQEVIAGLSADRRFFLGYALAWMIHMRPEGVASQVRSDVHSPPQFRVIGPLSDMPEFYAAFGVKPGDAMWRPDSLRPVIW